MSCPPCRCASSSFRPERRSLYVRQVPLGKARPSIHTLNLDDPIPSLSCMTSGFCLRVQAQSSQVVYTLATSCMMHDLRTYNGYHKIFDSSDKRAKRVNEDIPVELVSHLQTDNIFGGGYTASTSNSKQESKRGYTY